MGVRNLSSTEVPHRPGLVSPSGKSVLGARQGPDGDPGTASPAIR